MKNIAIIVAGGQGKRMGQPKQFLKIAGKPMVEWTISAFQKAKIIDGIILVVAKENRLRGKKLRKTYSKIIAVVESGKERFDSVKNGLSKLPKGTEIVLIHDGARPAVTKAIIEEAVRAARRNGAVVVGVPVKDTIKQISNVQFPMSNECKIIKTIDRSDLWQAQTPQVFTAEIIKKAYAKKMAGATDDAMLVENLGIPVTMVMGSYANFKVTTPEDIAIMGTMIRRKG